MYFWKRLKSWERIWNCFIKNITSSLLTVLQDFQQDKLHISFLHNHPLEGDLDDVSINFLHHITYLWFCLNLSNIWSTWAWQVSPIWFRQPKVKIGRFWMILRSTLQLSQIWRFLTIERQAAEVWWFSFFCTWCSQYSNYECCFRVRI